MAAQCPQPAASRNSARASALVIEQKRRAIDERPGQVLSASQAIVAGLDGIATGLPLSGGRRATQDGQEQLFDELTVVTELRR